MAARTRIGKFFFARGQPDSFLKVDLLENGPYDFDPTSYTARISYPEANKPNRKWLNGLVSELLRSKGSTFRFFVAKPEVDIDFRSSPDVTPGRPLCPKK